MGTERTVAGILSPYGDRITVWEGVGEVGRGMSVGEVGMAQTYAILLDAPQGEPPRFLWVQEGTLTNLMSHQAIAKHNVFDARGVYLGRGGEDLKFPQSATPSPLTETLRRQDATFNVYRFPVRTGCLVEFRLPSDLTEDEAGRIASFIELLPTPKTR